MSGQRGVEIESLIIRAAVGDLTRVPVDLLGIARKIGVYDIRPTTISDAFTDFDSGKPVIYQYRVGPGSRVRAIFAHELGHVMLRLPEVVRLIEARGEIGLLSDEEGLVDRLAAAILVPDSFLTELRESVDAPHIFLSAAQNARVPIALLFSRLASANVDVALLHWSKGLGHAWHVISRPGVPPDLYGEIVPSRDGSTALQNSRLFIAPIVVDCRMNDKYVRVSGSAIRYGSTVFHFVRPSRDLIVGSTASNLNDLKPVMSTHRQLTSVTC